MPISVTVAGTNCTAFVQTSAPLQVTLQLENRGAASLRLYDPAQAFVPEVGNPISIYDLDGTDGFSGDIVQRIRRRKSMAATPLQYDLLCTGLEARLDKRMVSGKGYIAEFPVNIVNDLLTNFAAGEAISAGTIAPPNLLALSGHAADSTLRLYALSTYPSYIQNGVMLRLFSLGTSPGGITADGTVVYWVRNRTSTTIQLSATPFGDIITITSDGTPAMIATPVIDLVFDKPTSVTDALNTIGTLTGSIWWVDSAGLLQFVARSATAAPFTITDSNRNFDDMWVTTTRLQYFNREYRQVSFLGFARDIETFHGDGTVQTWALSDEAATVEGITLNGGDAKVGQYLVDAPGSNDFYWRKGSATIYQDPAATVLVLADTIVVTYRKLGVDVIVADDPDQFTARQVFETDSSGIHESYTDDSSNADAKGALVLAQADVTRFAIVPEVINIITRKAGLRPGQLLTIHRASMNLASDYLLNQVTATAVPGNLTGQGPTHFQYFRYEAQTIDGSKLLNYIDYFKALSKGKSGSQVSAVSGVSAFSGANDGTVAHA